MGYTPVEVDVTGKTNIEVTLFEDVVSLQDVVVVGYNTVKRGQITGSIDMVNGDRIAQQTSATLEDRLQGKISGFTTVRLNFTKAKVGGHFPNFD